MASEMAIFEALAEDLSWFVTCPELRVLHIATGDRERPVVLQQVAMAEAHACNRSPLFVLEDAHTRASPGWQVRADRMRVIHEARRAAMAHEGYELGSLSPRVEVDDELQAFVVQVAQCLSAQRSVEELDGVVVVFAPGILEAPASFVDALERLSREPACQGARFIVIELGRAAADALASTLGKAALCTTCEPPDASAEGSGSGPDPLFATSTGAPRGASPEMRAGFAGPKDIVAPTRYGHPSRDALPFPEVEADLREALGPDAALAGPLGDTIRTAVFEAAAAIRAGRHEDAARAQGHARDLALDAGLLKFGSLLEITLATYRLQAGDSAGAREAFLAAAARASAAGAFDVAAHAHLGLGASLSVAGDLVAAAAESMRAGEAAVRAESPVLAIECFRLAGQHAANAGADDAAEIAWQAALHAAAGLTPEERQATSAAVVARAWAAHLAKRREPGRANALLANADAFERGTPVEALRPHA